ncbi:MAG: PAS domain S-box protein [Chryseolinea sp.]
MKASSARKGKKSSLKVPAGIKNRPMKEVVNPLTDGIVCVDKQWRYTYLNDAALQTHPLGRKATLGKSMWAVHPDMKGTIFWDKYHEAMNTGKIVEIESHYAPMNTWFFVKVYPSSKGLTILYMDITLRKRAEEEILHSKKILENTSDSIWSIDHKFTLLFCNSQFRNFITRLTQKEIQLGDDIRDFIPDDYSEWIDFCQRGLAGESFSIEQSKAYQERLFIQELFFNPILDDKQSVNGVSVFVKDITDRRKAEKDFHESEARYQFLINQLSDSVFVSDDKGTYLEVNDSACRLLGYTREELLTLGAKDILFSDETINNLPGRFEKLRSGHPDMTENKLKRKDGTAVDVEINTKMLTDGRFVGIVRDITDRKKAQSALDKREHRFRAKVENSEDMIFLGDREFRPLYRSPSAERITGYSFEDSVEGKGINDIHPDDKLIVQSVTSASFSSPGKPLTVLFRAKHKTGHYIWLEGSITNMFNDPNVEAMVVNLRDVTTRMDAQEKLAASEMRFRALIENITDGIVLNDEYSNLIFQSSSVERILGYTYEERKEKAVRNYVHPDNQESFESLYSVLKENPGKSYPFQYRFLHKKGHYIWLEGVVTNLLTDPSVKAYVANYRDITDRKMAEEELIREKTLLRTLIDNLPDYIYAKDNELKYLVNNKAHLNLMGVKSQMDAEGKTSVDILGAEQARRLKNDDENLVRTGEAINEKEEIFIDKTGATKFLLSTKVPIRDENNAIIGIVGITHDITKQKQTELELRNSNYFLESAQRAGKIGYWISDLTDSRKLTWSTETYHIFEIDPKDFNGDVNTFYELVHFEDREKVKGAASFSIEHHMPYSIDHRIVLKDGSVKWVHQHGEVTLNEKGVAIQLLGIVQDITERKKAEEEILTLNAELEQRVKIRTEQLQQANKEMEAFTYSVSHDLRSPLRIIDGYAQILLEDYVGRLDDDGIKNLNTVMSNARKMGKLIDDLLDFSRVGRTDLKCVRINMDDVVTDVLSDLQLAGVSIPEGLTVAPLASAFCDPSLLKQVWINLISNAIKYSKAVNNPVIEIGYTHSLGHNIYYVKDNGAGFDMKYYHKLFGVFQRLHSHTEFSGTGVGLAIVQRIIIRHGGRIWAESKVAVGSTFFFSLE